MKIQLNEITKIYAGEMIFDELNLEITKGQKLAIVGENGAGKSTLLKIIAGVENYQSGSLIIPKEMRVAYMTQVFHTHSGDARSYILMQFKDYESRKRKLNDLENAMSHTNELESVLAQYTKELEAFEQAGGYDLENSLESYAKGVGVHAILDQGFDTLSGGQKTRIALVQMLLSEAEVLCLDEPTNHMDLKGIEWLESYCKNTQKTLIVVSHDRVFLKNVVNLFHDIEEGTLVSYHGSYDCYRDQKKQRYLNLVNDYKEQQKEIQRIKQSIKRYRQWGNESNNEDFFKRAKTLEKRLERMNSLPKPEEIKNKLSLNLKVSERSGNEVIKAEHLTIGYREPLACNLNFIVRWKERFAIIADNGRGKTCLLKTLIQEIIPLAGSITIGESVKLGYLAQQAEFENPNERILQYIQRSAELSEFDARRSLASFGFYAQDAYKPLSYLSGGEVVRIRLLELMLSETNAIILDEPTNHLDILSCEIIEDALVNYEGTLIIVSHDRMLLDTLDVTRFELN